MILLIGLLPSCGPKRRILGLVARWQIHSTATIGCCVIYNVDVLDLGQCAQIRSFCVMRDLHSLTLGDSSTIGHWNWFSSVRIAQDLVGSDADLKSGMFRMGEHSAITSRHYIDCSGGVAVGNFTTLAGVRSTIISHQIDTLSSAQTVLPVKIGDFCLIGSNVKIIPGASIPDRCLVGMGAVVVGELKQPDALYAGVPARLIKGLVGRAYFKRTSGYVPFSAPQSGSAEPES